MVFGKWDVKFANIGQVEPVINKMALGVQLQKAKALIRILQKGRHSENYNVIARFSRSLELVLLLHYGIRRVDHCVLVNADSSVIFDSEEEYPIKLSSDSLRMCSRVGCPRWRVA